MHLVRSNQFVMNGANWEGYLPVVTEYSVVTQHETIFNICSNPKVPLTRGRKLDLFELFSYGIIILLPSSKEEGFQMTSMIYTPQKKLVPTFLKMHYTKQGETFLGGV